MEEASSQPNLPYSREFDDRAMAYFLDNPDNLRDLLRLKVPEIASKMRFEDAVKVDRTFIPPDLQKRTSDLIYKVPYSFTNASGTGQEVWVYILLENKSERSVLVLFQLFLYIFHILLSIWRTWEQTATPESRRKFPIIIPFVFYIGQQKWEGPLEFSQCFEDIPELKPFIPSWMTLFLNLNAVSDEELVEANTAASQVFRVMKAEGRPYEEYDATLTSVLESVAEMSGVTEATRLEALWLLLLQAYHTLSAEQVQKAQSKISDVAIKSGEKIRREYMVREDSYAAQLKREGKKEGLDEGKKEGLDEGRQEGIRVSLLYLIESRYGQPSEEVVQRIYEVDLDTVTDWIRKFVSANSLEELGIL